MHETIRGPRHQMPLRYFPIRPAFAGIVYLSVGCSEGLFGVLCVRPRLDVLFSVSGPKPLMFSFLGKQSL